MMIDDLKVLKVQVSPNEGRRFDDLGPVDAARGDRLVEKGSADQDAEASLEHETALDTLSRLLSRRNIEMLRLIKTTKPQSVAELSRLTGRPKASLMLTLRRLAHFGIITFVEIDARRKVPVVSCDKLLLEVAIDAPGTGLTRTVIPTGP